MNRYQSQPDNTMKQPVGGGGMDMRLLYLCGTSRDPHKGLRTGGKFRGWLPVQCPACNAKDKQ